MATEEESASLGMFQDKNIPIGGMIQDKNIPIGSEGPDDGAASFAADEAAGIDPAEETKPAADEV